MRWNRKVAHGPSLALAILLAACSAGTAQSPSPSPSGPSIVGTWKCGPPDAPGQDLVEIRADGTVSITQPGASPGGSVTWSLDGNRGSFDTPEGKDPFTVEPGRIVFDDGFTCAPAT